MNCTSTKWYIMERDRDFCCWQDLYNLPTKSTRRLETPTHGGKVINSSGWQLLPHQSGIWWLIILHAFPVPSLSHKTQWMCAVQANRLALSPASGALLYTGFNIKREVYSIRQIITPQESMVLWMPWTHSSNFKGHDVPDTQLWQIKATDIHLISWTAICNTTDFELNLP